MKAVILAGGAGSRIKALFPDIPKPMVSFAGKPLVEHIINWLKEYGVTEIILCLNYKPEVIKKYFRSGKKFGVKIQYLIEKTPLGTGGALKYAQSLIGNGSFLLLNGDTYFPIDLNQLVSFHEKKEGICSIALSQVKEASQFGSISTGKDGSILNFAEKIDLPKGSVTVNGGIYLFEPEIFNYIHAGIAISLERDILPRLIKKKNIKLYGYATGKNHLDIGTPSGYYQTAAYFKGASTILIRSRAPVRISFGGGGTDISPYPEQKGGRVINSTINKYVYGTLQLRDDKKIKIISADYKKSFIYDDIDKLKEDRNVDLIKAIIQRMGVDYGFELFVRSDVPPNTGLGSSASVAIATIGLFNHYRKANRLNDYEIAELAYKTEVEDLHNISGRQDQYAAVYGGFNFIEFDGGDRVKISPLDLPKSVLFELEKNLLLVYVGKRSKSGNIHKSHKSKISKGEGIKYLDTIKKLANDSRTALLQGELDQFGQLLDLAWEAKKKFNNSSSNEHIDMLYNAALTAGALGGRITGAGGGGHMILYCQSNKEQEVARVMQKLGAKVVDFSFDTQGLQVWEVNQNE